MKNLTKLALLGAVLSTTASAQFNHQMKTLSDPTIGDSNIKFSAESNNPEGVCKALGYASGVPGSIRRTSSYGYAAKVNSDGYLTKMFHSHYFISRVTCLNYIGVALETVDLIQKPVYPGTATRYSAERSNPNGICVNLGYDSGYGIARTSSYGSSLVVNANGEISSMPTSHYFVKYVTCVSSNGFVAQPPIFVADQNVRQSRLGFDFKTRALDIANTVFDVAKVIEPYINNAEERQIDALKKQAHRLKSRIVGGRKISVVRNTLYKLEEMLAGADYFIDQHLESDHLDTLAGKLMTARESILAMVDYIDHDYQSEHGKLY